MCLCCHCPIIIYPMLCCCIAAFAASPPLPHLSPSPTILFLFFSLPVSLSSLVQLQYVGGLQSHCQDLKKNPCSANSCFHSNQFAVKKMFCDRFKTQLKTKNNFKCRSHSLVCDLTFCLITDYKGTNII